MREKVTRSFLLESSFSSMMINRLACSLVLQELYIYWQKIKFSCISVVGFFPPHIYQLGRVQAQDISVISEKQFHLIKSLLNKSFLSELRKQICDFSSQLCFHFEVDMDGCGGAETVNLRNATLTRSPECFQKENQVMIQFKDIAIGLFSCILCFDKWRLCSEHLKSSKQMMVLLCLQSFLTVVKFYCDLVYNSKQQKLFGVLQNSSWEKCDKQYSYKGRLHQFSLRKCREKRRWRCFCTARNWTVSSKFIWTDFRRLSRQSGWDATLVLPPPTRCQCNRFDFISINNNNILSSSAFQWLYDYGFK